MARRPKSLKVEVWNQQNKRCYWCLCPIEWHTHVPGVPTPANAATVDHVYPVWHAKRREFKNKGMPSPFVMACHSCNNKRGGTSFMKYHELIGKPFEEPKAPRSSLTTRSFNNLVIRGFKKRGS
jgi:hypothetical protein